MAASAIKLAYVTAYDARDVRQWSGIGHYMAQALDAAGLDIRYVGPLREQYRLPLKLKQAFYKLVLRQQHLRDRELATVRSYARQATRQLLHIDPDVVFSPGTLPIAFLETDRPIVFWTDATFAGIVGLYPWATNLSRSTLRQGHAIEQAALDRCSLAIYSSEWAAETARAVYRTDPAKVRVVPFGANIGSNLSLADVKQLVSARPNDTCKLLFLGVEWYRKGGDIALEVARQLNAAGLPTELVVAGCHPESDRPLPDYVRPVGFVSKSAPAGSMKIEQLFAEAHFLILPTRADCTPVVFCEANSLGVPCLSTDVGGISTIIRNGVNGQLFAAGAAIEEYCAFILDLFSDRERYQALALASFNEYCERLNWKVAAKEVSTMLNEVKS